MVEGTSKGLATVAKGVETGVKGVGRLFVEELGDPFAGYNQQVRRGGNCHGGWPTNSPALPLLSPPRYPRLIHHAAEMRERRADACREGRPAS